MFDIGWSELLVIAIVLIVVVGPKDLPPMIRAFGKTMAGLRKMAGDFRSQFDEALKEADMDDVRQTISDVRNLNPTNSLRDAMNPLRQLGNEIKADLQGAATPPASPATSAPVGAPGVSLAEPEMKLPDGPPVVATATVPVAAVASVSEKPKRTRKAAPEKSAQENEAEAVAAKPKRVAKTVSAKPTTVKAVAPTAIEPALLAEVAVKSAKAKPTKVVAEKPKPAVKKPVVAKVDVTTPAKAVKTARAKKGEA